MADLSDVQSAQSVKVIGSNSTGVEQTPVNSTTLGELLTVAVANTAVQHRAQSVTTSAAEALGAASILSNRKFLCITPTNGTVYWGITGVTTSSGSPIFKNQTLTIAANASVHIFVISAGTVDCRIVEGS